MVECDGVRIREDGARWNVVDKAVSGWVECYLVRRTATSWWCGCVSFLGLIISCHWQKLLRVSSALWLISRAWGRRGGGLLSLSLLTPHNHPLCWRQQSNTMGQVQTDRQERQEAAGDVKQDQTRDTRKQKRYEARQDQRVHCEVTKCLRAKGTLGEHTN